MRVKEKIKEGIEQNGTEAGGNEGDNGERPTLNIGE